LPPLGIFLAHLIMHDGVPGCPALVARHVMLTCPSSQPQLFDQIQLRQYATSHNPFLNNEVHHPMITRMEQYRYIGPTVKFKEFFVFSHGKLPASGVKPIPCQVYAEISGIAGFDVRAV